MAGASAAKSRGTTKARRARQAAAKRMVGESAARSQSAARAPGARQAAAQRMVAVSAAKSQVATRARRARLIAAERMAGASDARREGSRRARRARFSLRFGRMISERTRLFRKGAPQQGVGWFPAPRALRVRRNKSREEATATRALENCRRGRRRRGRVRGHTEESLCSACSAPFTVSVSGGTVIGGTVSGGTVIGGTVIVDLFGGVGRCRAGAGAWPGGRRLAEEELLDTGLGDLIHQVVEHALARAVAAAAAYGERDVMCVRVSVGDRGKGRSEAEVGASEQACCFYLHERADTEAAPLGQRDVDRHHHARADCRGGGRAQGAESVCGRKKRARCTREGSQRHHKRSTAATRKRGG